jgi:NAD(P)-dependent dehydrogenase (short-subunit alcohol dehydrogenase family)
MARFEKKVVLVTGGSTGIGFATAKAFAGEGASVVIASRRADVGNEAAEKISADGGEAVYIQTDVSRSDQVDRLIDGILERHGRLDCAFNNAGIGTPPGWLAKQDEATFDELVAVNIKGTWLCLRREILQMRAQGGGAIVNCASTSGVGGAPSMALYGATKYAVVGLTTSAALECATSNIRINAVCPGWIRTPMTEPVLDGSPEIAEQWVRGVPMRRIGEPQEIAGAVLWLCSDEASFTTGHALVIGGGMTVGVSM